MLLTISSSFNIDSAHSNSTGNLLLHYGSAKIHIKTQVSCCAEWEKNPSAGLGSFSRAELQQTLKAVCLVADVSEVNFACDASVGIRVTVGFFKTCGWAQGRSGHPLALSLVVVLAPCVALAAMLE